MATRIDDRNSAGDGKGSLTLAAIVNKIAREMEKTYPPGDLADLRRMRPENPACPAFWKIVVGHLVPAGQVGETGPFRDESERRWAAILAGMAEMKGLHRAGRYLGTALVEADVSEARLLRLLRARDAALLDTVRVTAHQLASARVLVDWVDLAWLILSDGRSNEETVRRNIARTYYSHLHSTSERRTS